MTEAELIAALICLPPGYEVGLDGRLLIAHAAGTFGVTVMPREGHCDFYRFTDVGEAVRLFLAKREDLRIGEDFYRKDEIKAP